MNIAILGLGTIGSGVYELLKDVSDIKVTRILDIKTWLDIMTTDINDITGDKSIETVVETMGGLHPALEFALKCIESGKNYVTANKFLVSEYGTELKEAAKRNNVAFMFSAACGGGIPYLMNLHRVSKIDKVTGVGGILNGTTNFILDEMFSNGGSYEATLKRAQALGYAERDPSSDVDGLDTQRKLVLACMVAFGLKVKPSDIDTLGMRTVSALDVEYLTGINRTVRLIADGKYENGALKATVQPVACVKGSLESGITRNINYTRYSGERMGEFAFTGQGAGKFPTATNIISDIFEIMAGKQGMLPETLTETMPVNDEKSQYYLRIPESEVSKYAKLYTESINKDGWIMGITEELTLAEMITVCKSAEGAFAALLA